MSRAADASYLSTKPQGDDLVVTNRRYVLGRGLKDDPALIRHFFKNKETLFATTMADRTVILDRLVGTMQGPIEELGIRVT